MGIDIYARWKGQTKDEQEAQYTGYSTRHGHVGYLREAYHGEPYATHALLPEAFANKSAKAKIPAAKLAKRLPKVLALVAERQTKLYKATPEDVAAAQKAYQDFVALCEAKEKETGEPCTIEASY